MEQEIKTPESIPWKGMAIVVIKPDGYENRERIKRMLENAGLSIVKSVSKKLPDHFVSGVMYKDLPEGIEEETLKHFNDGLSEIILLQGGDGVIDKIVCATGEYTDPNKCEVGTVRYKYGEHFKRDAGEDIQYMRNAIHRPKDEEERVKDLEKFETFFA